MHNCLHQQWPERERVDYASRTKAQDRRFRVAVNVQHFLLILQSLQQPAYARIPSWPNFKVLKVMQDPTP